MKKKHWWNELLNKVDITIDRYEGARALKKGKKLQFGIILQLVYEVQVECEKRIASIVTESALKETYLKSQTAIISKRLETTLCVSFTVIFIMLYFLLADPRWNASFA